MNDARPLRVAIADDALLLREGIAKVLEGGGIDVVASVGTGDELLEVVRRGGIDAAVLDIRMPPTLPRRGHRRARGDARRGLHDRRAPAVDVRDPRVRAARHGRRQRHGLPAQGARVRAADARARDRDGRVGRIRRRPRGRRAARQAHPRRRSALPAHRAGALGAGAHGAGILERRHRPDAVPRPEDRRDARAEHPARSSTSRSRPSTTGGCSPCSRSSASGDGPRPQRPDRQAHRRHRRRRRAEPLDGGRGLRRHARDRAPRGVVHDAPHDRAARVRRLCGHRLADQPDARAGPAHDRVRGGVDPAVDLLRHRRHRLALADRAGRRPLVGGDRGHPRARLPEGVPQRSLRPVDRRDRARRLGREPARSAPARVARRGAVRLPVAQPVPGRGCARRVRRHRRRVPPGGRHPGARHRRPAARALGARERARAHRGVPDAARPVRLGHHPRRAGRHLRGRDHRRHRAQHRVAHRHRVHPGQLRRGRRARQEHARTRRRPHAHHPRGRRPRPVGRVARPHPARRVGARLLVGRGAGPVRGCRGRAHRRGRCESAGQPQHPAGRVAARRADRPHPARPGAHRQHAPPRRRLERPPPLGRQRPAALRDRAHARAGAPVAPAHRRGGRRGAAAHRARPARRRPAAPRLARHAAAARAPTPRATPTSCSSPPSSRAPSRC